MSEFHDLCATYLDAPEWYQNHCESFDLKVMETPYLKNHRDWVVNQEHVWGFGELAFHWLWKVIVETMPSSFRFLEIGCYRGQVLSLVGLIAKETGKTAQIYGVSPFAGISNPASPYEADFDYIRDIKTIFSKFSVDYGSFTPIVGMSQDPNAVATATEHAPFDVLYIDGSHSYEDVEQDIKNYAPLLRSGGVLVMDDAGNFINLPPNQDGRYWPGIPAVSAAVRDLLEPRTDFVHRFAVGHNRVFTKV